MSLQSQLAKLQQGQNQQKKKTVVSILYGKKDAQDIDIQTLHSLAVSHLDSLTDLNIHLLPLKSTLFSLSFADSDRMLLSTSDNNSLDHLINSCLRLLSPLLLNPASWHLLEYLIRRFKINEFNIDAIMEAILPYHETTFFVKVVSVLVIKPDSRWTFLGPVQKSNTPLLRSILIDVCIKDHSLLPFILKAAAESRNSGLVNKNLECFYATIVINFYHALKIVTDNHLRLILPHLLQGLASSDLEFRATMQMLLGLLSKKVVFDSDVLSRLIEAITENIITENLYVTLLCLVTLFQNQTIESFPQSAIRNILNQTNLQVELKRILSKFETAVFMKAFSHSLVAVMLNNMHVSAFDIAAFVLANTDVNSDCVQSFLVELLRSLLHDDATPEDMQDAMDEDNSAVLLIQRVQNQRFAEIDAAIDQLFKECKPSKKVKAAWQNILNSIFKGSLNETLEDSNTSLYLGLIHENSNIRLTSLEKLKDLLLDDDQDVVADMKSFLESTLTSFLNDSSSDIIDLVLDLKLSTYIHHATLLKSLLSLVVNAPTVQILLKALNAVFDLVALNVNLVSDDLIHSVVSTLLTIDITKSQDYNKLVPKILKLINIDFSSAKKDQFTLFNIVHTITSQLSKQTEFNFKYFINGFKSTCLPMRVFSMNVINHYIATFSSSLDLNLVRLLLPVLEKQYMSKNYIRKLKPFGATALKDGMPLENLKTLERAGLAEFEKMMWILVLVNLIQSIPAKTDPVWFHKQDESYESLMITIFKLIFLLGKNHFREPLALFISTHIQTHFLEFCFSIATSVDMNPMIQNCVLQLANQFMITSIDSEKDYQIILPSVMICLLNRDQSVRVNSITCLKTLLLTLSKLKKKNPSVSSIYGHGTFYGAKSNQVQYLNIASIRKFVTDLIETSHEIVTDENYLALNMIHFLVSSNKSGKDKIQQDLLDYFLSNTLAFSDKFSQSILLGLLTNVDCIEKVRFILPVLEKEYQKLSLSSMEYLSDPYAVPFLENLVSCFQIQTINNLFSKKAGLALITFSKLLSNYDNPAQVVCCDLALKQINSKWWSLLSTSNQSIIYSNLIDLLSFSPVEIQNQVREVLKTVELKTDVVHSKLVDIGNALDEVESSKRIKSKSHHQESKIFVLISFLETLQFSNNVIKNGLVLVPGIVGLLDSLLNYSIEIFPNIEYTKQLILATLDRILKECKSIQKLSKESLRTDLIVQCIRVTDNPQTHNSALLLLATIGTLYPDIVLMNIMPVFTFMGANVLKQDDNYSFHVVQQTLETIVPSLLSCTNSDTLIHVKTILDVFVSAIIHIPSHRRIKLFTILIQTLGVEYLGSLVSLLLSNPFMGETSNILNSKDEPINVKTFSLKLLRQFNQHSYFNALNDIMSIFSSLPHSKSIEDTDCIINYQNLSSKKVRQIKLHLIQFIHFALSENLIKYGLGHEKNDENTDIHMKLIESTLSEIIIFNQLIQLNSNETQIQFINKYVKIATNLLYENLNLTNTYLSLPMFLKVLMDLIYHSDFGIREKSLEMLHDRLEVIDVEAVDVELFEGVTNQCCRILNDADGTDVAVLENKQLVLNTLNLLVTKFGSKLIEKYSIIFKLLISDKCLLHANLPLVSSSMVTLASFINVLGPRVIPFLSAFVPVVLNKLQDFIQGANEESLVMLKSGLLTMESLISSIPQFSSSFLLKLIHILIHPKMSTNEVIAKSTRNLIHLISIKIEHRILFPLLFKEIKGMMKLGSNSILKVLMLLNDLIQATKQAQILEFGKEWFKLFITLFDFKKFHSNDQNDEIEKNLIDLFKRFTMKMNEKTFKPLFLKVVEWGLGHSMDQRIFFFKLINSLLTDLKSIFVPYFGFVLDAAIQNLNENLEKKTVGPLWELTMTSFLHCFTFDNSDFITQDRFDKLLNPLINQMDIIKPHGNAYKDQMTNLLIPCIGQLVLKCKLSWKPLTDLIFNKILSKHVQIRWTCLSIISELYLKLGEEMLIFFPPMIPKLSELLEDDDEEIQTLCNEVCLQIQTLLGEDIQQYFVH
ncbi:hypothetical protein BC833DRAFT_583092 [Globomyces pollinis-pini]|nr:hypothetical protein BC833DRAFT_583092 [Globomyces pollinis-pini]